MTSCDTSVGASIAATIPKMASGSCLTRIARATASAAMAAAQGRPNASEMKWYIEIEAHSVA